MKPIIPLQLGVQWAWASQGIVFSPNADAPNMGGNSFIMQGGDRHVVAIAWQSSLKVAGEILLHFMASPTGTVEGAFTLLSTHHIGNGPTMVIRDVHFPVDAPIVIPGEWKVWVYGEGGGLAHPAPVEIQTTLYVTDSN